MFEFKPVFLLNSNHYRFINEKQCNFNEIFCFLFIHKKYNNCVYSE